MSEKRSKWSTNTSKWHLHPTSMCRLSRWSFLWYNLLIGNHHRRLTSLSHWHCDRPLHVKATRKKKAKLRLHQRQTSYSFLNEVISLSFKYNTSAFAWGELNNTVCGFYKTRLIKRVFMESRNKEKCSSGRSPEVDVGAVMASCHTELVHLIHRMRSAAAHNLQHCPSFFLPC